MKGPHFFEKRKKEQARQEKLKQKADRKAQRKLEKDRGDTPGEVGDDDLDDIEGLEPEMGIEGAQPDVVAPGQDGEAAATAEPESRQTPSAGDHARGS